MRLYILYNGYLETDKNSVVALATKGTKDKPFIQNEWIRLPVLCFLIETKKGYILYDTGCNSNALTKKEYWPNELFQSYPLTQPNENTLENQLALCNVKPEQIRTVVLSHLHMDHAGNIGLFKDADIYVPREDYIAGQLAVHLNSDKNTHGAYIKEEMEANTGQIHLVDHDFELVPGVEIVNLPGHTDGLLGLVVHLEGGTMILPQDCLYLQENYGPPVKESGLMADNKAYFKSIEKVRMLVKKYHAKLIYAHDYEYFKTLKTAPEYYE